MTSKVLIEDVLLGMEYFNSFGKIGSHVCQFSR